MITALLPRMSANAADAPLRPGPIDFSSGVRLGSVIVAPAALVLAVLGPALGQILLGYGNNTDADARYLGIVFAVFSLGLMPYMLFQLLLRVFYALHDSKTPALIGVVTMITNVAANVIAYFTFPPSQVVAALGVGFGLANLVGTVVAWQVLSKRLGGLAGREIGRLAGQDARRGRCQRRCSRSAWRSSSRATLGSGKAGAFAIVVAGGAGALLIYFIAARALRVSEVTDLIGTVRARLGR